MTTQYHIQTKVAINLAKQAVSYFFVMARKENELAPITH